MSEQGLRKAQEKMAQAGVGEYAIKVFSHYYAQLESGATGIIEEIGLDPLPTPPKLEDIDVTAEQAREALSKTAIIKLNGGLGTSMGMDKAKSLLPVDGGRSFLDLIVAQVRSVRAKYDVTLPLIFMNSFRTEDDTMQALQGFDDLRVDGLPLSFVQSQEPRLLADTLEPLTWEADPSLEWCPPGHGDLYPSLLTSGILDKLIDAGYDFVSVSNSDNLGAAPNAQLAGWFAATRAPYATEVCYRTPMDLKGGHFAVRKSDGHIILRETAQTADEDMKFFTDPERHPFCNTNNLWFNLKALREVLISREGVLGLPLIRNVKNADPKDSSTPLVYQVETAMGAAVEVFPGAVAVHVPRSRFAPVKTTNELLLLRSDVYAVEQDGFVDKRLHNAPVITLDKKIYKTVADFEKRFPAGPPSLIDATSFTVKGDWTFEEGVIVKGDVTLEDNETPATVPASSVLS